MRISTKTIYDAGMTRMSDGQAKLLKIQQQVASGQRILSPADDPVGAARALNLTQGQELNNQFAANRVNARNALSHEESVLQQMTGLFHDLKSAVVQAGNPAFNDEQRKYIAVDLQTRFEELLGMANTRDGVGNYLFGGYQITAQPFTDTANGVRFNGDQGKAMLQVDSARQMATADSGAAIFEDIKSTRTFAASVAATNTGTLATSRLSVTDATQLTGHQYDIVFSIPGSTYSVYNITLDPTKAGAPLASGPYASPQAITFDGLHITASGAPANSDMVTIRPSDKQSIFTTLKDVITLLQSPGSGPVGNANLTHGLGIANDNFTHALDNVLAVRASVGSRLKELDLLDETGDAKNLQYAQSLSQIQDLDYNKALSELTIRQTILEASQKSFVKVTGLSLFALL